MSLLYKLGVLAYVFLARTAALFSPKAQARVRGATESRRQLAATPSGKTCYWMHCASVGEFEQGRTLWDLMIKHHPEARFVLSFFSPSGYGVFAHKENIGEVVYLPWDIGSNASDFVRRLSPKLAIFVKYEWWLGYFEALDKQDVPTVVISAAFRQNQPFFNKNLLQSSFQKALTSVEHLFVQDESSAALLTGIKLTNFTITGDTRIDRTLSNRDSTLDAQPLTTWAKNAPYVLVAGSTWLPHDVELLADMLQEFPALHLIIAPHEINQNSISRTASILCLGSRKSGVSTKPISCITLSSFLEENIGHSNGKNYRAIILDSIGLLSRLYRLGDIAYIGGGFGAGIHNTLEAAVYGIPIAFGPKYHKFQEAIALIDQKIATEVANAKDLSTFVERFSIPETKKEVLAKAERYIEQNQGATQRIWDHLIARKLI